MKKAATKKKTATKRKVSTKPKKNMTTTTTNTVTKVLPEVDEKEQAKLQSEVDAMLNEIALPLASHIKVFVEKRKGTNPLVQAGIVWAMPVNKRPLGTDFFKLNEPLEHVRGYSELSVTKLNLETVTKVVNSAMCSACLAYNGIETPLDFYVE